MPHQVRPLSMGSGSGCKVSCSRAEMDGDEIESAERLTSGLVEQSSVIDTGHEAGGTNIPLNPEILFVSFNHFR